MPVPNQSQDIKKKSKTPERGPFRIIIRELDNNRGTTEEDRKDKQFHIKLKILNKVRRLNLIWIPNQFILRQTPPKDKVSRLFFFSIYYN